MWTDERMICARWITSKRTALTCSHPHSFLTRTRLVFFYIYLYPPYAALYACQKRWISLSQPNTLKRYILYVKIIPKISVWMDFFKGWFFFSSEYLMNTKQNFEWPVSFGLYFAAQKQVFQNHASNGRKMCIYVLNVIGFPLNVETSYIAKV